MNNLRTYKLKITSEHLRFTEVADAYKAAANWLSKIIFSRGKPGYANHLQREFYNIIRERFQLPSQVTCSLFKQVVVSYKSMRKNGEWELAVFKRRSIPIVHERDFGKRKKGISVWGEVIDFKSRPLPEGKWGDSKLKQSKGVWYLCLTIEVGIADHLTTGYTIGVDRGQINICCAMNPDTNRTFYAEGTPLNHRRLNIRRTRAEVASVGTRSAYRLLKRLSGREKAVTQEIMHIASKQLVTWALRMGVQWIAGEELTGFKRTQTKNNKKVHHKQRARNNRWPYAMFWFFVAYKAAAVGIGLDSVEAAYTSRCCPKCGHTSKNNRRGLGFECVVCGFADNADRVGATNIARKSMLLRRQAAGERAVCQSAYSSSA